MDVFANMSTTILSPIWGSIRVVLVLARNVGRVFERVTECLGRIGDILPQLLVRTVYSRITIKAIESSLTPSSGLSATIFAFKTSSASGVASEDVSGHHRRVYGFQGDDKRSTDQPLEAPCFLVQHGTSL
jgi:hypothetical protein